MIEVIDEDGNEVPSYELKNYGMPVHSSGTRALMSVGLATHEARVAAHTCNPRNMRSGVELIPGVIDGINRSLGSKWGHDHSAPLYILQMASAIPSKEFKSLGFIVLSLMYKEDEKVRDYWDHQYEQKLRLKRVSAEELPFEDFLAGIASRMFSGHMREAKETMLIGMANHSNWSIVGRAVIRYLRRQIPNEVNWEEVANNITKGGS